MYEMPAFRDEFILPFPTWLTKEEMESLVGPPVEKRQDEDFPHYFLVYKTDVLEVRSNQIAGDWSGFWAESTIWPAVPDGQDPTKNIFYFHSRQACISYLLVNTKP